MTDADEQIWLVFWEAGIIFQVPVGVLIIFPSALLLHFNINMKGTPSSFTHFMASLEALSSALRLVATKGGDVPRPDNCVPIGHGNTLDRGRGSMVWFTQATMLSSAELPGVTITQVKEMEHGLQQQEPRSTPYFTTSYDLASALANGLFPINAYARLTPSS